MRKRRGGLCEARRRACLGATEAGGALLDLLGLPAAGMRVARPYFRGLNPQVARSGCLKIAGSADRWDMGDCSEPRGHAMKNEVLEIDEESRPNA